MKKILFAIALSVFALSLYAADTDNQTDGAELGTNETPQAQDQSKNSNKATTNKKRTNKTKRTNSSTKHNHQKAGSSEENPLQPTESEPAPGASTK